MGILSVSSIIKECKILRIIHCRWKTLLNSLLQRSVRTLDWAKSTQSLVSVSLSAPSMKAWASSHLFVYHNLDPDCQIGSASVTKLQASHVYYLKKRPNFIWREAQSYLHPPRCRVAPTNIPNLHLQHPPPRGTRSMQAHSLIPLSKCLRCLCNLLGLCRPLVGSLQRLLCRFCLPFTSSICKFWSYLLRCGQILGLARFL